MLQKTLTALRGGRLADGSAQPYDMNIEPPHEYISTEVIMDGQILHENLKRMGLDLNWLKKELETQGYKSEKEVFLGVCDSNNQLTLFA